MSDESRKPQLETLLALLGEQLFESLHVMMPCKVTAYDEDKQFTSVQPMIQKSHVGEDEKVKRQTLPEIHDVPVSFQRGTKGGLTTPVVKGDLGMVMFSSLSMAVYKLRGGIVDPGDDRRHDYNDCVFVPGFFDAKHLPHEAPTNAVVLHAATGIKVKIGGPTDTQRTLMGDTFMDLLQTLLAAIATQIAGSGTPAGATAAAAAIELLLTNPTLTGFFDPIQQGQMKTAKTEVK